MIKLVQWAAGGVLGFGALAVSEHANADNCCQSSWSATAVWSGGWQTATKQIGGGTCTASVVYGGTLDPPAVRESTCFNDVTGAYSPGLQLRCRNGSSGTWLYSAWQSNDGPMGSCGPTAFAPCTRNGDTQYQIRTQLADNTYCFGTCSPSQ